MDGGNDTDVEEVVQFATVKRLLAGAVAGAVAKTAVAPLDRTKILMQVSQMYGWKSHRGSVSASMRVIWNTEGVAGFFRGNSATVARIMPYAAIQYTVFENANELLSKYAFGADSKHPLKRFLAGAMAGSASVALTYPIDMTRTVLAVRTNNSNNNSSSKNGNRRSENRRPGLVQTMSGVTKERGIGGLYRGVYPTLVGVVPYAGISFLTFGQLKKRADASGFSERQPFLTSLFAGGTAGLVAQCFTYPLDLVRRRLQALHNPEKMTRQERAFLRAAKTNQSIIQFSIHKAIAYILRTEGYAGLYRGISINFMKTGPAMAISFTAYDAVRKAFGVPSGKFSATSA